MILSQPNWGHVDVFCIRALHRSELSISVMDTTEIVRGYIANVAVQVSRLVCFRVQRSQTKKLGRLCCHRTTLLAVHDPGELSLAFNDTFAFSLSRHWHEHRPSFNCRAGLRSAHAAGKLVPWPTSLVPPPAPATPYTNLHFEMSRSVAGLLPSHSKQT